MTATADPKPVAPRRAKPPANLADWWPVPDHLTVPIELAMCIERTDGSLLVYPSSMPHPSRLGDPVGDGHGFLRYSPVPIRDDANPVWSESDHRMRTYLWKGKPQRLYYSARHVWTCLHTDDVGDLLTWSILVGPDVASTLEFADEPEPAYAARRALSQVGRLASQASKSANR